jgi:hypothetical protein
MTLVAAVLVESASAATAATATDVATAKRATISQI